MPPRRRAVSGDIFAGQPTDADLLAQLYDLEHDAVVEDLIFYREQTRRSGHTVLDLGCGSGRLLRTFAAGKARAHRGGRWLASAAAHGLRRASPPSLSWRPPAIRAGCTWWQGDVRRLAQLPLRQLLGPAAPTWWWPPACCRISTVRRTRCGC